MGRAMQGTSSRPSSGEASLCTFWGEVPLFPLAVAISCCSLLRRSGGGRRGGGGARKRQKTKVACFGCDAL